MPAKNTERAKVTMRRQDGRIDGGLGCGRDGPVVGGIARGRVDRRDGGVAVLGGRFGRGLDRRVVLKGIAGVAAMSLGGGAGRGAAAAGPGMAETLAGEWWEAEAGPETVVAVADQSAGENGASRPRRRFRTDFAFSAIAPHWGGEAAPGATVELRLSADGEAWSEPLRVRQSDAAGGRPDRNGRRFGQLVATEGASFVAYQTLDADGNPTTLPDLAFTYIDASPGPTLATLPAPSVAPALAPPPIVTRQQWGANEALRFGPEGESWPVAYAPVEHLIVHHTDTANFEDPLVAIRSIYYYTRSPAVGATSATTTWSISSATSTRDGSGARTRSPATPPATTRGRSASARSGASTSRPPPPRPRAGWSGSSPGPVDRWTRSAPSRSGRSPACRRSAPTATSTRPHAPAMSSTAGWRRCAITSTPCSAAGSRRNRPVRRFSSGMPS